MEQTFCDLGLSPISNAFVKARDAQKGEMFYPLKACVCERCWLVQLERSPDSEAHFHDDYVYFSSYSASWLAHAKAYVEAITARLSLTASSKVMELASNDGYLLQYFVEAGIPCMGIEPTSNTAAVARQRGVETLELFFGREPATKLRDAGLCVDLLIGNNVLAHVPDINDFIGAMPLVLKPNGTITLEFPHLLKIIQGNQFDTIYHEHYCYLSLLALEPIFARFSLRIFDVERLTTHGGSLRLFVCKEGAAHRESAAVAAARTEELAAGLSEIETYLDFASHVRETKRRLLDFLIQAKSAGKTVVAYGAAAKGNTLLNYCGVGIDLIDFVADKNPAKQGRLLPGTRIPVVSPDHLLAAKPDYVLILPWNIKEEVMEQMAEVRTQGGHFVAAIPKTMVLP